VVSLTMHAAIHPPELVGLQRSNEVGQQGVDRGHVVKRVDCRARLDTFKQSPANCCICVVSRSSVGRQCVISVSGSSVGRPWVVSGSSVGRQWVVSGSSVGRQDSSTSTGSHGFQ